jgi:hypothetical protein
MNVEYHICFVRTDLYFVANNVLLCCVFCGMVGMCFGLCCVVHYTVFTVPVFFSMQSTVKLYVCCNLLCSGSSVLLGLCAEFCSMQ